VLRLGNGLAETKLSELTVLIEWPDILRLLFAVVAGAVIGFERELYDKPAGLRTNIMICLGAALFTLLSVRIGESRAGADETRIAAQIVTGVGFLGAGAIIQFRASVIGLTTAATIWLVASVGMAFGAGEYVLGVLVTILATAVLFGLSYAEDYIASWRTAAHLEIQLDAAPGVPDEVKRLIREGGARCRSWSITKAEAGYTVRASLLGPEGKIEELQGELMANEHVLSLKRL
jgi:putative Mg2+ transporter-C (MgtC) family protein